MQARILALLLIALLAFPATVVRPPQASTQASAAALDAAPAGMPAQDAALAAANKKKRDKNGKKPKYKTITTTVRQPVTQTFTNPNLIDVPNGATPAKANPYPALIEVAGFTNGTILDVDVTLHGFTWNQGDFGSPNDADILVAASHLPGATAIVLSDVANSTSVTNLTLKLNDEAAAPLPSPPSPLVSGTFQPTNINAGPGDTFPAPAPLPSTNSSLSVFDGGNPNGTWQLFVVDDDGGEDPGSLTAGWSLQITAEGDVQVTEKIKIKKHKKHKKGKKGKGKHYAVRSERPRPSRGDASDCTPIRTKEPVHGPRPLRNSASFVVCDPLASHGPGPAPRVGPRSPRARSARPGLGRLRRVQVAVRRVRDLQEGQM